MPDQPQQKEKLLPDEVAENAGARMAAIKANPQISLEETRNAAEGKPPSGAGGNAPSTAEDHVPSRSDPEPSDLPSSDNRNPT